MEEGKEGSGREDERVGNRKRSKEVGRDSEGKRKQERGLVQ